MDRFELEDKIMNMHTLTSDLNALASGVLEEQITMEEAANAIIGLAVLNTIKVNQLFDTFKSTFKLDEYHDYDTLCDEND